MSGWAAIPEPKQYFLALCSSNITILGIRKTPLLACGVQWYGWLGRHPRTQTICFGTVQFKHHHQRNSKTPLLACGVQWYGWLGRHPRTQTIIFGIVQFKHQCPRYPKTPLLACGVQWYGWVGAPPQNPNNMFWHCAGVFEKTKGTVVCG